MKLNKNLLYILFFTFLAIFSSCSDDKNPVEPKEETIIVSKNLVETLTKAEIETLLGLLSLGFPNLGISPKYDVDIYKIEYYSKGKKTAPIVCSGIICEPKMSEKKLGIASWQHISIISNSERPSEKGFLNPSYYEPVMTASIGYISASNDYLGFGASQNEPQSYHISAYTSEDWLQFMKATNEFISQNSISTSKDLWIMGYSQGGYNAASAMKKWENENHNFFNLREVFAGAGAYSLTELFDEIVKNKDKNYAGIGFSHLFVMGYNYYYDLNLDYSKIYLPEFQNIDDLFDENKNSEIILPDKISELYTEEFINELQNKTGNFYNKLPENNLSFIPKNKLFLFHSAGDDFIPFSIAENAFQNYSNSGGNVELIQSGNSANHGSTFFEFVQFVFGKLEQK